MMSSKQASNLLDLAFTTGLDPKQQERLQEALVGSAELCERYRRLQLAERVAAHGPEVALEAPSEFEIDRMARGLGLMAPAPRVFRLRRWVRSWFVPAGLALSAAVALFALNVPAPEPHLQARGSAEGLSLSAYVVSAQGQITELSSGARLEATDRLKLRLSWQGEAQPLSAVWVGIVDHEGRVTMSELTAPEAQLATVPGFVDLPGTTGPVRVYVMGTHRGLSQSALKSALSLRPDSEDLPSELKTIGAYHIDIEVREAPASQ